MLFNMNLWNLAMSSWVMVEIIINTSTNQTFDMKDNIMYDCVSQLILSGDPSKCRKVKHPDTLQPVEGDIRAPMVFKGLYNRDMLAQ